MDLMRKTGLLMLLWSLFGVQAMASVRVIVSKSATVSGDEILLGDVARIEGSTTLGRLVLGKSPRPGNRLSLPGSRIRIRILREIPGAVCEVPGILRVERAGQAVSLEKVKALVEEKLRSENPDIQVQIKDLRITGKPIFGMGTLVFGEVDLKDTGRRVRGQIPVFVAGRDAGSLRFVADVDRVGPVLVLARDLDRGVQIRREHLRVEERDLTGIRGKVLRDPAAAIGMETRVRVSAGEVLHSDRLTRPALVKRGDRVRLVVENNNMRIHTLGEARRDGGRGERIPVENLYTGKVVQGEVASAGVVRLAF